MTKIHISKGNIAQIFGDAFVEILCENHDEKDCEVGRAKLVIEPDAFKKHLIKTIVPKWHGGNHNEIEMLARSQIACLDKAAEAGVSRIVFSAKSNNYDDYPYSEAAYITMSATALWIDHFGPTTSVKDVYFICDDETMRKNLEDAFDDTGLST